MPDERRQSCMEHAEKLGLLTGKIDRLTVDIGEIKTGLKDYMGEGHLFRKEVVKNKSFREEHEAYLANLAAGRKTIGLVYKFSLWICAFVGGIAGAIYGVKRLIER